MRARDAIRYYTGVVRLAAKRSSEFGRQHVIWGLLIAVAILVLQIISGIRPPDKSLAGIATVVTPYMAAVVFVFLFQLLRAPALI